MASASCQIIWMKILMLQHVSPKFFPITGKIILNMPEQQAASLTKYGYPFCRGRILNVVEKDEGQYDDQVDIFWSSGACMIVRTDAWKKCGGFDADFFAHMEEIDLCWRFNKAGYRIGFYSRINCLSCWRRIPSL